ncbi:MAG: Pls/PosA family non-ribosomal peptide synthetase, partial [Phycicoccus sp.]
GTGLVFQGRADDQVKVGGRRIELGEIDSALLRLEHVTGAAAAVRRSDAGNRLLVGYVTATAGFDAKRATERLRATMPAALVPRVAVVDTLPTRTSGKIDRDALPWPLPTAGTSQDDAARAGLTGTAAWLARLWSGILGAGPDSAGDDFFDLGGGSLTAAQLVSRLRERHPEVTVADVYEHPTVGGLAAALDAMAAPTGRRNVSVLPVPLATQVAQVTATVGIRAIGALRWLTWAGLAALVGRDLLGMTWLPEVSWPWVALGWLLLVSPLGRVVLGAAAARALLAGLRPGRHPRGGRVHLRLWLAERLVDELGATSLSTAPLVRVYARLLGCRIAPHVDLHSVPPVTGMLRLGTGCAVEPEVDLAGHWIDGDHVHVGEVRVRADARVGARSTLLPGADVGARAEIAPGSAVFGTVPADEAWSGAPAVYTAPARGPWTPDRAPHRPVWQAAYAGTAAFLSLLPVLAVVAGILPALGPLRGATSLADALATALLWVPLGAVVGFLVLALLVILTVRLLSLGLEPGHHPVHGLRAWQAWSVLRVLDEARTWLFPLYSSSLTPVWLRALGAEVDPDVEASTVLLLPRFVSVGEGAFLADDTLVGGYELAGGWLRVERVRVGKGAFVGNSGMAAPGRKVPKRALVAVLSAAPRRGDAKAGSSWLGSPPRPLRREADDVDISRTHAPPTRLRVARALVEGCRALAVWVHVALVVLAAGALLALLELGAGWAVLLGGPVLLAGGALAAGVTTGAKWLLVGRLRPSEHPLWSSFVWRNELADTFVEVVAAPWLARAATGTAVLNLWLRSMGARIGRGVWCETYWLPEADLIELRDGATVGRGCVVQTHLFHDRVLSMDTVTIADGGTLGPNSVVLPAARIGRHATVGPVSLVMRGESVPDKTRWIGNPVGPWAEDE